MVKAKEPVKIGGEKYELQTEQARALDDVEEPVDRLFPQAALAFTPRLRLFRLGYAHQQQRGDGEEERNHIDGQNPAEADDAQEDTRGKRGKDARSTLGQRKHAVGAAILLLGKHGGDGCRVGGELEGLKCSGDGAGQVEVPNLEIVGREEQSGR